MSQAVSFKEEDALDSDFQKILTDRFEGFSATVEGLLSDLRSLCDEIFIEYVAKKIHSNKTSIGGPEESVTSDGEITSEYEGIIKDLLDAMDDNSPTQTVEVDATNLVEGAMTADADNIGDGTWTGPAFSKAAKEGRYAFECNSDVFGEETFEVSHISLAGEIIVAKNYLTVDENYLSTSLGITSAKLQRKATDAGSENDHFSNWKFDGEDENNTDDTKLYGVYTASNKTLKLYKDSAREIGDLVASGLWAGALPQTIAFQEENNSGLIGSVDVIQVAVADPTDSSDLQVTLDHFQEGDYFYLGTVRRPENINYTQEFFADIFETQLPEATAGYTIYDRYARRGFWARPHDYYSS